ncbi:MAG: hypothetical protein F6J94_12820, partial [Moorea sp. SIO1F2]|uniref:hypothetical protein n=1 Tax=Moorena sp. SIO1F2 TaxID=2607819 RepID=UPI0013B78025
VILTEAFIFSSFPNKTLKLPQKSKNFPEIAKVFENKFKIGEIRNIKQISIDKAEVRSSFKYNSLDNDELHVLLSDVEWVKQEKHLKFIKRNYKGYIQFKISYDDNPSGEFEMKSEIVDYSFRPGSGFFSFVIGFVETAYLVPRQRNDIIEEIDKFIQDNQILEKLK